MRADGNRQPSKFALGETRKTALRLHHLDKAEHFIRTFVGIALFILEHFVFGLKIFTPKLVDLKAALVYVKMKCSALSR